MAVTANQVDTFYLESLARHATAAEQLQWVALSATQSTAEIQQDIAALPESSAFADPIVRLYQGAFNRLPDTADPNSNFDTGAQSGFWVNVNFLRNGGSLLSLAQAFVDSAEFLAHYGSRTVTAAFITELYHNVLGRDPESAQVVQNWINSGLSAAQILIGFTESAEFKAKTQATIDTFEVGLMNGQHPSGPLPIPAPPPEFALSADVASVDEGGSAATFTFAAPTHAGEAFAYTITGVSAGDINVPLTGTLTLDAQGNATLAVSATADNVTEGLENLVLTVAGVSANVLVNDTSTTPLILGQGTDNLTGTDGNDEFSAQVQQTALLPIQTLNNTDKLDGGAGRDALSVQLVNPFTVPAQLKSIEILNVDGAPGFIVPPVTLDVVNADSIDTINFRAPTNDVTINNLKTVLTNVSISDQNGGQTDTINHTGTQLNAAGQKLSIDLSNVGAGSNVNLVLNGTGGYDELDIHSNGGIPNHVHISGSAQDATKVVVDGAADLRINDSAASAWNMGVLNNFDGSAATGMLTSRFNGPASVASTVSGGSNDDNFLFVNTGAAGALITVNGNGGNDTLRMGDESVAGASFSNSPAILNGGDGNDFLNVFSNAAVTSNGGAGDDVTRYESGGFATFGDNADKADGGTGNDRLEIEVETSGNQLLAAAAGSIINTEVIRHVGEYAGSIQLNVNMANNGTQDDGSQSLVQLAGNGGAAGGYTEVNVTNLQNNQTIEVRDNISGDLDLSHANLVNDVYNINLFGGVSVGAIDTANNPPVNPADAINLASLGGGTNVVQDASKMDGDIAITGNTNLVIGAEGGNAYNVDGGVIDAHAFTGGLTFFGSQGSQTLIDGSGNSFLDLGTNGSTVADTYDISASTATSADTIVFGQVFGNVQVNAPAADRATVFGWSDNDQIRIDLSRINGLAIDNLLDGNGGGAANANFPALQTLHYSANQVVDISGAPQPVEFIHMDSVVAAGGNAQAFFNAYMGGGTIDVGGNGNMVFSMYEQASGTMTLFLADSGGNTLYESGDTVTVLGTVHMSLADYQNFDLGSNLVFQA